MAEGAEAGGEVSRREELEELEEALSVADHVHKVFVMALIVSTIISGGIWIYERVVHSKAVPIPLEIQAMVVFLVAFAATFYITNARKMRHGYAITGAVLLLLALWGVETVLSRVESAEERILIVSSLILGIIGHVLYSNRKLMERVEWLLMLLLGGILIAVLLVWLFTLRAGL
ncbi:hypothetical protein GQS_10520 [Thermococcus sp. 4557]|uniref:hypothetical protein n=1 Tax=Thermococcus sp. (strain CGMCC 1.5172 / 4557) TaxID=1042877 RepID=UPI000219EB99|nr:hypothetical protein [Thermococcus sp. 4557]AEK73997.1 hypothetical protein GQS_10520 [Thermococcus sp. 4557]